MHVVHCINNLPVGGAEQFLVELVRQQQRLGLHVRVLSLIPPNPLATELEVPFECLGRRRLNDPRVIRDLVRTLRSGPVDLLHTHLFYADTFGRIAARWCGIPCISTEHSTEAGTLSRRRQWGMRVTVPWARRVVAVSPAVQAAVCKRLRLPTDRVPIIPNGLDLSRFQNVTALQRAALSVPADAFLVGCVGRLVASKGLDALLQALTRPSMQDVHLLLVGEGPERPTLERQAAGIGVTARIHWLGLRRDVPEILAALDVFAMPSHWEGHSIALLEAMASGCALVVSNVPELTGTTGDAAVAVAPGNADSIAAGIRALREDDRRQRAGAAARQQAQRFSIESAARSYQRLYNEVAGSIPASPGAP